MLQSTRPSKREPKLVSEAFQFLVLTWVGVEFTGCVMVDVDQEVARVEIYWHAPHDRCKSLPMPSRVSRRRQLFFCSITLQPQNDSAVAVIYRSFGLNQVSQVHDASRGADLTRTFPCVSTPV